MTRHERHADDHRADGAAPHRTAVIVVAGIGDEPVDDASRSCVQGLLRSATLVRCTETVEWYRATQAWFGVEPLDPQPVRRFRLHRAGDGGEVDVYDMWWADLSRFPGALRSALIATFGLLLRVTSVGRAALRGGAPLTGDDAPAPPLSEMRGSGLLGLIEWILAVPLLLLSLLALVLVGGGSFAIWSGSTSIATRAGLAAGALVVGVAWGWWLVRSYRLQRWGAAVVGIGLYLGIVGLTIVLIWEDGGRGDRGAGDALIDVVIYPFRIMWMLEGALVLVLCAFLFFIAVIWSGWNRLLNARAVTAVLSLLGLFGFAAFVAVLDAAAGAALKGITDRSAWPGGAPSCLSGPTDWTPGPCDPGQTATAYSWGVQLFGEVLIVLAYAAIAVVLCYVVCFILSTGWRLCTATARQWWPRSIIGASALVEVLWWALVIATPFCAAAMLLSWTPVARGLPWERTPFLGNDLQPDALGSPKSLTAPLAALSGLVIAGAFAAAKALKLTPLGFARNQPGSEGARQLLDHALDVTTWLGEPSVQAGDAGQAPRRRILARFAALAQHVTAGGAERRPYSRLVVFAHSQGTTIATAFLNDPESLVPLPADVALITLGTPLRHFFLRRLPVQFAWVESLRGEPTGFCNRVTSTWLNFGADSDLVGRTLFVPAPPPPVPEGAVPAGSVPPPTRQDWSIGPGGHGAYWSSPIVFEQLAALL